MVVNLLSIGLIGTGLFFMLVAAIGFVRFPDIYCRLHVIGVLDTLGAPMMLLGVAVHIGVSLVAGKLLLAIIFLFMTSPLVGHLLSVAAVEAAYQPEPVRGTRGRVELKYGARGPKYEGRATEGPAEDSPPSGRHEERA